jgi:hypothetical protein
MVSEVCPSGRLQKDSLGIGVSTRSRNATTTQSKKFRTKTMMQNESGINQSIDLAGGILRRSVSRG